MKEQRKFIRITPSRPIEVKFRIVPNKRFGFAVEKGKAFSKNISIGGMFIELPLTKSDVINDLLSGKAVIALEFKVPGYTTRVKIIGRVRWVEKKETQGHKAHGIGIQFEKIDEKDREHLVHYMLESILH